MFAGQNMWMLKPTSYNRGRGIHVFGGLTQLQVLINEYMDSKTAVNTDSKLNHKLNIAKADTAATLVAPNTTQALDYEVNKSVNSPRLKKEKEEEEKKVTSKVKTKIFVIQKYLERPLLIKKRKFDIRLWVLVTQDLKCYLFREGYIRMSSKEYTMNKEQLDNPFVHLTNNAIQRQDKSSYGTFEEAN